MVSSTKNKPDEGKEVEPAAQKFDRYDPVSMSWDDLASTAHEVLGADLAKDELMDALVGVPFIITRVTFRRGIKRNGYQAAYVSCEAVIAPESELRKRRVNLDNLPFAPGGSVVFNDGSTGIYRQVVAYLRAAGFITLPDGPEEGESGVSIYDLAPADWTAVNIGELGADSDGFTTYDANIRLKCPRGLRLSTYTNDAGDAKTRYFG